MKSPARPFVRNPYNYDQDRASLLAALECVGPTLTQQQFKDECDINVITERFGLSGELPTNLRAPQYGDFTAVSDFQSAMQAVRQAEEAFMELPAAIRDRFGHNPQRLLEFCADPSNREEAGKLGLVELPEPVTVPTPPAT